MNSALWRWSGLAAMAMLAAGCGQPTSKAAPETAPAAEAPAAAAPSASAASVATVSPEIAAEIAALPAPYNAADYMNGRRLFAQCRTCHVLEAEGGNKVGPNLAGMFGRKAGAVDSFAYSPAVKNSGLVWDGPTLDQWLANPRTFLPGNRMSFAGIRKEEDRRDLIAYLKVETAD